MSGPSKIASKVKFPKLSNPPSYKGFVKGLIDLPSTKKVISTMTKDIVDLEYKGQLRSMPSLDERSLITYLGQVSNRPMVGPRSDTDVHIVQESRRSSCVVRCRPPVPSRCTDEQEA